MANGSEACCAMGICCPALSAKQRLALAKIIEDGAGKEQVSCEEAARVVLEKFDLAPVGSLQAFKDLIVVAVNHHTAKNKKEAS